MPCWKMMLVSSPPSVMKRSAVSWGSGVRPLLVAVSACLVLAAGAAVALGG